MLWKWKICIKLKKPSETCFVKFGGRNFTDICENDLDELGGYYNENF